MLLELHTSAMTIPQTYNLVRSKATVDNVNMSAQTAFGPNPRTSLRMHPAHGVTSRGFRTVPDIPYPWQAVFATTTSLQPVNMSAKLLRAFYLQVVQSILPGMPDRWQHTFQMGYIMLAVTSRDRKSDLVTRELITGVCMMLNEYAKGGFADLFFATLWHDLDGLAVDIQLMIMNHPVEGLRVT
ncbi:MAG: hypothetical protein Q9220_002729 [cf. Caloplaca sp. 1 TL-2023]